MKYKITVQYNTPIDVYNDSVIEEMVKTMDYVPARVGPTKWYYFGAHTKRLLDKTSPRQNVSIQNIHTTSP
jgi:hypothetical protein